MAHYFRCDDETAVVETTRGKVKGYLWDDLTVFKGIPYATAKRFQKAVEPDPWEGVKDASCFGFVCPLLTKSRPNGELGVPHRYWLSDEDCLNLNIWTPACDGKKRPVIVWLHGGAYEFGSAIEHQAYDGDNLSRYGDVVVVTVNHRLNILGYLDVSSLGPDYCHSANNGTLDLVMALKWIQKNISAFGGDPGNVTIWGQSGGGGKVAALLQTPAADELYHKAVIMSGTVTHSFLGCEGEGTAIVAALKERLNLKSAEELATVPYELLKLAYNDVSVKLQEEGEYTGQAPLKDDDFCGFIDEAPMREETLDIPVLIGTVFGEFSAFVPAGADRLHMSEDEAMDILKAELGEEGVQEMLPLFKNAYPERPIFDLLCLDSQFRPDTQYYIRERAKAGAKIYSYLFCQDMNMDHGSVPAHCADVPYFFGNTDMVPQTQQEGVKELEEKMLSALIAFSRTGNPGTELLPAWPASTAEEEACMIFKDTCEVRVNHDRELIPLHQKYIVPYSQKIFQMVMEKMQH
ncbi:MAG: carboxylesterase family protein [Clostridiales bacterium]|nr:carboxylesterase family protein [Clostridiales bacterium]